MKALPLLQRLLPPSDPRLAHLVAATGAELHADGLHLEAERYLRQALGMMVAHGTQPGKQAQGYSVWLLAQVGWAWCRGLLWCCCQYVPWCLAVRACSGGSSACSQAWQHSALDTCSSSGRLAGRPLHTLALP